MMNDILKYLITEQVKRNKSYFLGEHFTNGQKVYFWTNENIKGFIDTKKDIDKALVISAGGDMIFSLIHNGVLNIDSFDTNAFTIYFIALKQALILKYNYQEFIDIINVLTNSQTSLEELTSILLDLIPYIDTKYQAFWQDIINYNYSIQSQYHTNLNLFDLITIGIGNIKNIKYGLNYLENERSYNKLKKNIPNSNVTFTNCNGLELKDVFKNKYDMLYLSNIMDYFIDTWGFNYNIELLKDYIDSLDNLMNSEGIMYLKYIFLYNTEHFTREHLLYQTNITVNEFREQISDDIVTFPSLTYHKVNSAMLYKRIK